jgi:hypothetical protein
MLKCPGYMHASAAAPARCAGTVQLWRCSLGLACSRLQRPALSSLIAPRKRANASLDSRARALGTHTNTQTPAGHLPSDSQGVQGVGSIMVPLHIPAQQPCLHA